MTIQVQAFTLTKPAAPTTGTVAYTNLFPFSPQWIYVFSAGRDTNATYAVDRSLSQGVALADLTQGTFGSNGTEGGVTGVSGNSGYVSRTQIMSFTFNNIFGPNLGSVATLVSFDDNGSGLFGMTWDWTTNVAGVPTDGEVIIHGLAFTGMTTATFREWQLATVPGSYAVTGVGQKSDLVFSIGATYGPDGTYNGATGGLSCFNCQGEQWVIYNADGTFSIGDSRRYAGTDGMAAHRSGTADLTLGTFTSMTDDGWEYDSTGAAAGNTSMWFSICMTGVGSVITGVPRRTSAGLQSITLPDLGVPVALVLAGDQDITDPVLDTPARMQIGIWANGDPAAISAISATSPALSPYGSIDEADAVVIKINDSGTVVTLATVNGVAADSAILNFSAADADAEELYILAFGEPGAGSCFAPRVTDWVWDAPAFTLDRTDCVCIPIVNNAGSRLIIRTSHCGQCVPQPFSPLLFADSERKSVPVPVQTNVIQWIVNDMGVRMIPVNNAGEVFRIITTALILSKANADLYGHYLGWHLQGTDPPFRIETVEMEYQPTRVWDTTP